MKHEAFDSSLTPISVYCYTFFSMMMNSSVNRKRFFNQAIVMATLMVFSFLALVSINSAVHMTMDEGAMMANCPFMIYQDTLCQMTLAEHVEHWREIVTGTIQSQGLMLTSWLLLTIFFSPRRFTLARGQRARNKLPRASDQALTWHSYLSQAFSDGILHPKIYPHTVT